MHSRLAYRLLAATLATTLVAFLSSCEKKDLTVNDLQIKDMPTLSARNVETMYSDSGKVTLLVRSPLIQQYDALDNNHTLFPEGLTVFFYDTKLKPQASISSKYARFTEKDDLWELRDSVMAININGDTLSTELLYWSQTKDKLWSDRFVMVKGKDKIIMGTGFESDSRCTWYKFKNIEKSYILVDEQKGTTGN